MKIFISFSSKDMFILKNFVNKILKLSLHINDEGIHCTGIEASKPRSGDDFRLWIRNNIANSSIIIQLISQSYKESEVCLNELGASWASNARVIPILIPPIDYDSVGFIHSTSQLLKIDLKSDLFKLIDEISEILSIKNLKTETINSHIDDFLDCINNEIISRNDSFDENEKALCFNIFEKMLIEDIDVKSVLLKSQPTLYDCRKVFHPKYSIPIYESYSICFKDWGENIDLSTYNQYEVSSADYYELLSKNHNLPMGMNKLIDNHLLNKDIKLYQITFKKKKDEYGFSLSVWAFINGRWVFFPKPWGLLNILNINEI